MPYRPNKPCAEVGCSVLVPPGVRRCQAHQSREDGRYNREQRPKAHSFYHTAEWRAFRTEALRQMGKVCTWCGNTGQGPTNPIELDHIVPISEAPGRALDITNVRPMCRRCHGRRTAQDQGRWRRRG